MMKLKVKVAITFIVLFVALPATYAQSNKQLTQTIRGVVTDRASGEPLQFVSIMLELSQKVTATDADGNFILQGVALGRHTVKAAYIGYEKVIIKEVLVGSAKEVFLEIALIEKPLELGEIVVRPKIDKAEPQNEMALLGAQMFSVEEAGRFAGGMDDPARLASSFAGVAAPNVSNNGISIHGNAPSLLQWRVEGIEIHNPNHFADVDVLGGGFLAALSSNVLANSDFYVGAFPAEYGNAISGVFDMKLRNGSSRKYQHTFQLGVLGIDFASEGPISRKHHSSYIVNYRYSTTNLIEKIIGTKDMGGSLGYQDLNFKFYFPTKKAGTFSLWGVGQIDKVTPILDDPSGWEYLDEGILTGAKQSAGSMGLSNRYLFGNRKTSLKTTLALTHSDNRVDDEYCDLDENRAPRAYLKLNTTNYIINSYLNHKFGARHTNKTGVTLTHMKYGMNLDFSPIFSQPLENISNSTGSTTLIAAYTNSRVNIGRSFVFTAGINLQHLALNRNTSIEPRVGLKWQASPKSSFAVGYGLHSRMEKLDVYFVKDGGGKLPNKELELTKSHHVTLSYVYRISDDMNLRIEPYFQHLYNVPVTEDGSYSILNRKTYYITEMLVSKGTGRNYGIDLTFEKYLTKGLYYMVTASLFDSKYQGGDGVWYNTRYNRKFIVNGLVGKEWMFGRDILGVNLKVSIMGGKRYTPVDEEATLAHPSKEVQYDETRMFAKQFSPMFIGDFSISYKMNRKRVAHEFAIKSVNGTKQKEYVEHRYNIRTNTIEPYEPKNSMFNVSYRLEF